MGTYIHWNHKLKITRYPGGLVTLYFDEDHKGGYLTKEDIQEYKINDTAAEIITLINGENTYDSIVEYLAKKYNENINSIKIKVDNFLEMISKQYGLSVVEEKSPLKINIVDENKEMVSPMVASIEITNQCNIRCIHCYGDFGEISCKIMNVETVKRILMNLRNLGVRIVEITGGEATTHPDIEEIMEYALSLPFDQVSLLTNGVKISEKLKDILEMGKERVYVQIDLHSLKEEYFAWFTKVSNVLEKVKNNIISLAEKKVMLRIATILTPKNIDEITDIADWVHELGIIRYAVSPVVSLGRADETNKELFLTQNDALKAEQKLQSIVNKYDKFLNVISSDFDNQTNCGCITSHVVIDSGGNIKMCTMDNMEYFKSNIGNVFQNNIKDIFYNNAELLNTLFMTNAPRMNSKQCYGCENAGFCNGCLLRALIKAKEKGDECSWYQESVPDIIRKQFIF